ncbi:MAG: hypothetical protein M1609_03750, partial [Firmicutes bacterium]|nr:hypothetical protein [Bacillota bacterium]
LNNYPVYKLLNGTGGSSLIRPGIKSRKNSHINPANRLLALIPTPLSRPTTHIFLYLLRWYGTAVTTMSA